jgi:hypothetical protein
VTDIDQVLALIETERDNLAKLDAELDASDLSPVKRDVAEFAEEQPAAPDTAEAAPPSPALRDATSALARIDESAQRARRLGKLAEEFTFIVGKYPSMAKYGPAYMNVAVKAMREETRAYETAIKLAQVLTGGGAYSLENMRGSSWTRDQDEEEDENA